MNRRNSAVARVYQLWREATCQVPPAAAEPPYQDKHGSPDLEPVLTQGTLALSFIEPPPPVRQRPVLRLVPSPPPEEREPVGLPALDPWVHRIGQAMIETLTGDRTADQLVPWTTERVHRTVVERMSAHEGWRQPAHGRVRPRVRSVRIYRPSAWVAEATVVAHDGRRPRAVALRLEADGDRWLCTAVEFGR